MMAPIFWQLIASNAWSMSTAAGALDTDEAVEATGCQEVDATTTAFSTRYHQSIYMGNGSGKGLGKPPSPKRPENLPPNTDEQDLESRL